MVVFEYLSTIVLVNRLLCKRIVTANLTSVVSYTNIYIPYDTYHNMGTLKLA